MNATVDNLTLLDLEESERNGSYYWIADYDRKMMVQFVLQPNQKYGAAQFFFQDESITPMLFPDLTLDLAKIFID